jgi:hypothetical protein
VTQHFISTSQSTSSNNNGNNSKQKPKKTIFKCEVCVTGVVVVSHDDTTLECDSCGKIYCNKCGKLDDDKTEHKCIKSDIETFDNILSTTRSCPKCGARIYKSSGCNDMFCTICHIGFNWNTGAIITKPFHNPHRESYISSLNDEQRLTLLRANVSENEDDLIRDYVFNDPRTVPGGVMKVRALNALTKQLIRFVTTLRRFVRQDLDQNLTAKLKSIEFLHEMHLARQAIANPKTRALYTPESLYNIINYRVYDDLEYSIELDKQIEKLIDKFIFYNTCDEIVRVLIRPAVVIDQYMIVGFKRYAEDIRTVFNSIFPYLQEAVDRLAILRDYSPGTDIISKSEFESLRQDIAIYKALNFSNDIITTYASDEDMFLDIDNIIRSNLKKECNKELVAFINDRVKPIKITEENRNRQFIKYSCGAIREITDITTTNELFNLVSFLFAHTVLAKTTESFYDHLKYVTILLYMYIHDEDVTSLYDGEAIEVDKSQYVYGPSMIYYIVNYKDDIEQNIPTKSCLLRMLHILNWSNDTVKQQLSRSNFVVKTPKK